ncbi:hypothetical protein BDP81DRAFT_86542 [Colletotrichum phormii]|uniref:Uncharacterized protein n=1 Tax=Colletotrichum phormii TaxID=359342 RepID=A0AAJ0A429_9PEZI|nr:uncharacterized protein BDP81DRAFT_86542 [Colletotrichum phormii]KAK1654652.1 hypothetical protein BDP81DRAFT_86542 [Colletotrichum phormii]
MAQPAQKPLPVRFTRRSTTPSSARLKRKGKKERKETDKPPLDGKQQSTTTCVSSFPSLSLSSPPASPSPSPVTPQLLLEISPPPGPQEPTSAKREDQQRPKLSEWYPAPPPGAWTGCRVQLPFSVGSDSLDVCPLPRCLSVSQMFHLRIMTGRSLFPFVREHVYPRHVQACSWSKENAQPPSSVKGSAYRGREGVCWWKLEQNHQLSPSTLSKPGHLEFQQGP